MSTYTVDAEVSRALRELGEQLEAEKRARAAREVSAGEFVARLRTELVEFGRLAAAVLAAVGLPMLLLLLLVMGAGWVR